MNPEHNNAGGTLGTVDDPNRQPVGERICPGVNCSAFGEKVLIMARPWQDNLLAHAVVGRMVEVRVGGVFILQVCAHVIQVCATTH